MNKLDLNNLKQMPNTKSKLHNVLILILFRTSVKNIQINAVLVIEIYK